MLPLRVLPANLMFSSSGASRDPEAASEMSGCQVAGIHITLSSPHSSARAAFFNKLCYLEISFGERGPLPKEKKSTRLKANDQRKYKGGMAKRLRTWALAL